MTECNLCAATLKKIAVNHALATISIMRLRLDNFSLYTMKKKIPVSHRASDSAEILLQATLTLPQLCIIDAAVQIVSIDSMTTRISAEGNDKLVLTSRGHMQ